MRLAIASLPCLSLILVGCSSYNAPKAAPTPLPVPTPPAATPMFSVVGGMYTVAQTVTISDATAGAIVYYTTNGSAPTPSSNQYAGPVTVGSSETLMATAIAPGHLISAVASASYTITPQPPPPNGTVLHGQVPLAGAQCTSSLPTTPVDSFNDSIGFAATIQYPRGNRIPAPAGILEYPAKKEARTRGEYFET
jgi:Chitobiase/beta-hexosaminidase C-terminal domain